MALPNDLVEEIRRKADIVSLISSYIPLTKKGRNYWGVCPFHDDSNPSLSVSEDKQIYKCFSCGAGGNVFTFVQEYEHVSFIEAVKTVAAFINMDISSYLDSEKTTKKVSESDQRMFDLIKEAHEFYQYNLESEDGEAGNKYIEERQLDSESVKKFGIGYALKDGTKIINYLIKKGFTIDEILASGIGVETSSGVSDRFKGRLIFPLHNLEGKVVAFSGRRIGNEDVAKYVNSPETNIFIKGDCLYNYHLAKNDAKKKGCIYVVEGFMDVIALSKIGINNVVGIMGTAFTEAQIMAIRKLKVKVVMALDNDEAGQSATFKILGELEKQNLKVSVVDKRTDGKDLDELLKLGKDRVMDYLDNQLTPIDFQIKFRYASINEENFEEKKEFVKAVVSYLNSKAKDDFDREYYISYLAKLTGFSFSTIKNAFTSKKTYKNNYISTVHVMPEKPDRYERAERNILNQMLNSTKAIRYYENNLNYLYDKSYRSIARYILQYYYDNATINSTDLISSIDDPNLVKVVIGLLYEDGLEKSFVESTFNVIKLEKPLEMEIQRLEKEKDLLSDDDEKKLKICAELNSKKRQLRQLKNKSLEGGN